MNPELDTVDDDIREWYVANFDREYVPGVPIKIQIVRLLRRLLEQGYDSKDGSSDRERPKNDVEPQKSARELGRCCLIAINRLNELLGQNGGQCTADLLLEAGFRMCVSPEAPDQLGNGLAHVNADLGVTHMDGLNSQTIDRVVAPARGSTNSK